jgi:hypothetical protein
VAEFCDPAVAGALGLKEDPAVLLLESALTTPAAETRTGFGTGYTLGTDPKFAYV